MLDRAIFRRFDEVINFAPPSKTEVSELVRRTLVSVDIEQLDLDAIYTAAATAKLGHAEVCVALERALKDNVLAGTLIDTTRLIDGLAQRARFDEGAFA